MSLLKKASIITTPTAYAEDYLYSIKPAYALGSELILNGNFDTDTSNWFGDSGASLTWQSNKSVLVATTDDASFGIAQGSVLTSGKTYRVSFRFKPNNTTTFRVRLGASGSGQFSTTSFTANEWNDVDFVGVANGTTFEIGTVGGSISNFYLDNVSCKEVTDADFDFDRNSTGTRVNEDYLIEDVPYNLITRSEDFSYGAYTKYQASIAETTIQSPISGSYVESISNTNTGTTFSFISQNLAAPDREVNITLSVYAKKGTYNRLGISSRSGDTFGAIYDLENGTVVDTHPNTGHILASSIQSAGNDFYLCSITVVKSVQYNIHPIPNNISDAELLLNTLSYTETGNVNIFGAQVVKGDQPKNYLKTTDRLDIPRIDYTNGEPSILLEPQRQNLVTYSQDLSQWTLVNGTLTANATVSPEGIQNSDKIAFSSVGLDLKRTVTVVAGQTYTLSFYIKVEEGTGLFNGRFYDNSNTTNIEYYDYADQITPNQWSRITRSVTAPSGCTEMQIWLLAGSSTLITASWWGAQFEEGSYATSLIHTSGSAVTRSADAATNAGNSDLINSTEGVLYAEVKNISSTTDTSSIVMHDGTNANRVQIALHGGTDFIYGYIQNSGGGVVLTSNVLNFTSMNKIAVQYNTTQVNLWINGAKVFTAIGNYTSSNGTLKELSFETGLGQEDFYGNAKSVMVFKEALADLELAKLTGYNNHELYMNYYNRLSYLGLVEEYNVESDINNYIL